MKTKDQVMKLYNKLKDDIKELDINIMQDSFSEKKWIETIKKEYKIEYFLTLETSLFIGRVISNTLFICMAFLSADFIMNIFIIFVILQAISVIKLQFDMNKYNNIR